MAESIIRITQSAKPIRITSQPAVRLTSPGTSGEANLIANVGGGDANVFRDKIGATLNLRTISGIGSVTVAQNGDVIEIRGVAAGDVVGPAVATDTAVARFDTTTGKLLQDSAWLMSATQIKVVSNTLRMIAGAGGTVDSVGAMVIKGNTGATLRAAVSGDANVISATGDVVLDAAGTVLVTGGEIQFSGAAETISRTAGELLLTAASVRTTSNFDFGGFARGGSLLIGNVAGQISDSATTNSKIQIQNATTNELFSNVANVSGVVGWVIDNATALTFQTPTRPLLLSVRNAGIEKWNIDDAGNVNMVQSAVLDMNTGSERGLENNGLVWGRNNQGDMIMLVGAVSRDIILRFGNNVADAIIFQRNTSPTEIARLLADAGNGYILRSAEGFTLQRTDTTAKNVFVVDGPTGAITIGDGAGGSITLDVGTGSWSLNSNGDVAVEAGHDYGILNDSRFQIAAGAFNILTGNTVRVQVLNARTVITNDLDHDGANVGFYGTAPAAQSAAHVPTNVTPDRVYDADSTTLSEIADVLGTLIADLQATGLIG